MSYRDWVDGPPLGPTTTRTGRFVSYRCASCGMTYEVHLLGSEDNPDPPYLCRECRAEVKRQKAREYLKRQEVKP